MPESYPLSVLQRRNSLSGPVPPKAQFGFGRKCEFEGGGSILLPHFTAMPTGAGSSRHFVQRGFGRDGGGVFPVSQSGDWRSRVRCRSNMGQKQVLDAKRTQPDWNPKSPHAPDTGWKTPFPDLEASRDRFNRLPLSNSTWRAVRICSTSPP